jgi:hypothetical protein
MRATDKELAMYGQSEQDIREDYMNSMTARYCGMDMVIAGILSDCQELLAMNPEANAEKIRKQLNVAKYIIFAAEETV